MRIQLTTNRKCASCLGAIVLALCFLASENRIQRSRAQTASSQDSTAVRPAPANSDAERKFAEAEALRTEQREESNRKAVNRYKEAADLWQSAGYADRATTALRDAGEMSQLLGDTKEALDSYNQSLALSRKSGNVLEESRVLNLLASLEFVNGDTRASDRDCRRALQLGQTLGDNAVIAQATSNIGETFFSFGVLSKAVEYQQQALSLWQKLGDVRGQSQALVALAYYHRNLGEPAKAIAAYNEALSFSRGVNDLRGQGQALIGLGSLKAKLSERQEAIDSFVAAKSLMEQIGDRVSLARTIGGLGDLYYELGDFQKALALFNQALALFERGGEKWAIAEGHLVIGRTQNEIGDHEAAFASLHRALNLFSSLSMPRLQSLTLTEIGKVYSDLNDRKNALKFFNQALKLTRLGQDQRNEAYTLNYIGRIYAQQGEFESALTNYRLALSLNRIAADQAGEVLTLCNIARVERDRGNLEEAKRQIEKSTGLADSLRANMSSQDLRATYFAKVREAHELYVDILMQSHKQNPTAGFAAKAFGVSEGTRARSFLESLYESGVNIREGVDAALLEKERTLQQSLNAKAERQILLLARKEKAEADNVAKEIDSLTTQFAEVRDQIRATSPRYAALVMPQPLDLTQVQHEVLDRDSVLLEYTLGEQRSYLWAVTQDGLVSFELAARSEIEESAQRLRKIFVDFQPVAGEELDRRTERQAKAAELLPVESARLSKLVLSPLRGQLRNRRLLIVSDGALQYIPFQLLPDPDSVSDQTKLLLENHEIVYEASASTLDRLEKDSLNRKAGANSVAVLADPVFELDDPRVKRSSGERGPETPAGLELRQVLRDIGMTSEGAQIPRLFASGAEADGIIQTAPWGTGLKAVGFAANRERVLEHDLADYRIVHFATHGIANNEHPELSGIVLSLLEPSGQARDGFLRLHDIYNLHLPVDLVVLSACSTGLGKDVKGEGLIGLTRGFMYAGASGVVATLWKVDDEATAELMKLFYQGMFKQHLPPAAALRKAQLELSQQKRWHSPYYWAGFVIQGRYDQTENNLKPIFLRPPFVSIVAAGSVLLLFTSYFAVRRRRTRII